MIESHLVIERVAIEGPPTPDRGYTFRASYLKERHSGYALIEILKDGKAIRYFLFPAYKIYNIAAHFHDIVNGEIENSTSGYEMEAWDGISGSIIIVPKDNKH